MENGNIPDSAISSSQPIRDTKTTDVRMGGKGVCFDQNVDNFVQIDAGKVIFCL